MADRILNGQQEQFLSYYTDPKSESFKTCNPHGVELLHSVRLHGAKDMERKIHEVLKAGSGIESYREWYKLTPDQLATMIAGLNAVSLSIWKTN